MSDLADIKINVTAHLWRLVLVIVGQESQNQLKKDYQA
jgi:hypothetical protein